MRPHVLVYALALACVLVFVGGVCDFETAWDGLADERGFSRPWRAFARMLGKREC